MHDDFTDLERAARETVAELVMRAKALRRGGHDGLALELELMAARLNVPLAALDAAAKRRAEDARLARLSLGG